MVSKNTQPTSFRLSNEAQQLAADMAKKLGISKTAIVEMAIRKMGESVLNGERKRRRRS